MNRKVRVYIAEEQQLFREAYKALLVSESSIEVVGISESLGMEGISAAIPGFKPDVLLFGVKMLQTSVIDMFHSIRSQYPQVGLVLLPGSYNLEGIKHLREFARKSSKGCAYLQKYSIDSVSQLVQVIHSVAEGRVILDPGMMERLIEVGDAKAAFLKDLTSRELEVLSWMSKGMRNNTIAEVLCLDPKTVERHINNIYSKLDSNVEARHPRVHSVMLYLKATGQMPNAEAGEE